MRLAWNEIRARAAKFATEWADEGYEKGESQTFYNEFFEIFGVRRRSVARFEKHVQKLNDKTGFIDLFWPGVLIVEQKSAGRDLAAAYGQAGEYFDALKEGDRPRFILVSDFKHLELYDLDEDQRCAFELSDLPKHVDKFRFILGFEKRTFRDQDPVNIAAAQKVGKLHDALESSGYVGHDLERFLVRLVFCLFADDTGVFEPRGIFLEFLEVRTREDGSDLGVWLAKLFEVLDKDPAKRGTNLDEDLCLFPHINGELFKGATQIPDFTSSMREALIDAARFDWSAISPAIFGALFQSVMDREERRQAGAHYTTEKNILKVIGPLFLDELRTEFEQLKLLRTNSSARLKQFQEKLGKLKLLDPACGCGNFLVIAYRELRQLELEVLQARFAGSDQLVLDVSTLSVIDVDQFAGIEIGEFAARIAETAMWMMDHIMNTKLSLAFGDIYARIPLLKSPSIRNADALTVDWGDVIEAKDCAYILGNPPFVGHQWRDAQQQAGMHRTWGRDGQVNRLDYVTCWFKLAAEYAKGNTAIKIAFVSTNSISQGEQASILWSRLFSLGVHIFFAHRTFQWSSEGRGQAAVHCVIVGFQLGQPTGDIFLYDYEDIRGEPHRIAVKEVNGYLADRSRIIIPARSRTPPGLPAAIQGSKPADGARLKAPGGGYVTTSNLILDHDERAALLEQDPLAEQWMRPYVGSDEMIYSKERWCLWLKDADPAQLRQSAPVMERLERVRKGRLQSPTLSVQRFANFPTLFTQDRQPNIPYIAVPEVSSSAREYIPIAILPAAIVGSNKLVLIPGGELFHFAVLTSAMHMGWVRSISGRMKSDYSYSPNLYNTFPWPDLSECAKKLLTASARRILDVRSTFPDATLADLYDLDSMPVALRKAHLQNDNVVEKLYRSAAFNSESERVGHLFSLYEKR